MARPLRIHVPGRVYHLFARGDNKAAMFRDDIDYTQFLRLLARGLTRLLVDCIAYCLLANHYHLLVIPSEHSVSRLMQQVNSGYCQWFNRRHGRVGHVLQGRFGSRIVDDREYLTTVLRYVSRNPVAAGCVRHPGEWTWSSYRATAGICECPPFLALDPVWTAFGCADATAGRPRFVAHVENAEVEADVPHELLLGGERLAKQIEPLLQPYQAVREFPYAHRYAARRRLDAILLGARSDLALKHAAAEAFHRYAYTLQEIGDIVGRSPSTIARWITSAGVRS